MGLKIGSVVLDDNVGGLKIGTEVVGGMKAGTEIVYGAQPSVITWSDTIGRPLNLFSSFVDFNPNPGLMIDSRLVKGGAEAYLRVVSLSTRNQKLSVELATSATSTGSFSQAGPDLIDDWKSSDSAITISARGGRVAITLPGPGTSESEPFDYEIAGSDARARAVAFLTAYNALTNRQRRNTTVTLST